MYHYPLCQKDIQHEHINKHMNKSLGRSKEQSLRLQQLQLGTNKQYPSEIIH